MTNHIPENELLLLDTCILLHIVRGNEIAKRILDAYNLSKRQIKPLISIISVGEINALVLKFGWGRKKIETLNNYLCELNIIDISSKEVIDNYTKINHYLERVLKPAKPMGQNDQWIAACAKAADAWFLTADKDFLPLQDKFIKMSLYR